MSTFQSTPSSLRSVAIASREVTTRQVPVHPENYSPSVYNLTVLVLQLPNGEIAARAANLNVSAVQALSIRGALSQIVTDAKRLISECIALGGPIPWIDPPLQATDKESQFLVPLHL